MYGFYLLLIICVLEHFLQVFDVGFGVTIHSINLRRYQLIALLTSCQLSVGFGVQFATKGITIEGLVAIQILMPSRLKRLWHTLILMRKEGSLSGCSGACRHLFGRLSILTVACHITNEQPWGTCKESLLQGCFPAFGVEIIVILGLHKLAVEGRMISTKHAIVVLLQHVTRTY